VKERLRILVVDDDLRMASTLADILTWEGYEVAVASNGIEALKAAQRLSFDCVISDIRMPDMDGVALSHNLHAIQPDLPMILMSAYAATDLTQANSSKGVLAVLDKPLEIGHVLNFLALLQQTRTVVVVDDDALFLQTLGHILESHDFAVKKIVDPLQVIDEIDGYEEVVLLDMKLKNSNGCEVLQQIRTRHADLPVLIVTGYAEEMTNLVRQAFNLKVYGCLHKPLDIPKLLHLLAEIHARQLQEALMKR
jgi:DNA-binding NtrC family response regulator